MAHRQVGPGCQVGAEAEEGLPSRSGSRARLLKRPQTGRATLLEPKAAAQPVLLEGSCRTDPRGMACTSPSHGDSELHL